VTGRPGVRTGARIETSMIVGDPGGGGVAPVFAPGRGLKPNRERESKIEWLVAPVFAPGRGLKLAQTGRG